MRSLLKVIRWLAVILTVMLLTGLLYYGITTGILDWDNRSGY